MTLTPFLVIVHDFSHVSARPRYQGNSKESASREIDLHDGQVC